VKAPFHPSPSSLNAATGVDDEAQYESHRLNPYTGVAPTGYNLHSSYSLALVRCRVVGVAVAAAAAEEGEGEEEEEEEEEGATVSSALALACRVLSGVPTRSRSRSLAATPPARAPRALRRPRAHPPLPLNRVPPRDPSLNRVDSATRVTDAGLEVSEQ
jgi:hypothetical protein